MLAIGSLNIADVLTVFGHLIRIAMRDKAPIL